MTETENHLNRSYPLNTVPSDLHLQQGLESFVESDTFGQKTWSRVFAESIFMKFPCYNVNGRKENRPDLKLGWAFYEHVTLARHFIGVKERAEPGEKRNETQLYSLFKTSGGDLNDWGIGIALYFNTVRIMAFGLLLAGLLSIHNLIFYASDEYDYDRWSNRSMFISDLSLSGSAVCTSKEWVVCDYDYCDTNVLSDNGILYARDESTGRIFVEKSNCGDAANMENGMYNYAAMLLLLLITILFNIYQSKKQVLFDEDKITASDYSVRVRNPPTDAYDCDKWRDFFSQYDDKGVTAVTVILNNQDLLYALIERRHLRKELQKWLPNTNLDNETELQEHLKEHLSTYNMSGKKTILYNVARPLVKCFNMFLYADELFAKLEQKTSEIRDLQKKKYDVVDVLVSFETEKGQRTALHALDTGRFNIKYQRKGNKIESELFDGKHVLDCIEPAEPSAMKYLEIETTLSQSTIKQTITLIITLGLVGLGGYLTFLTRKTYGPLYAGFLTTALNMNIPIIIKLLMILEKHGTEDDYQKSMYLKITIFRWVNTAITIKFVTPFTSTLSDRKDDLLPAINGIFVSEMTFVPVLAILDIMGNISKHWFAPRAKTIHQMFLCFRGTPYNLAEKYTDMSKIVFLSYYYAALSPLVLFMGSVALFIRYYADKFCLLRIWSSAPYIGSSLATFSRLYYFSFAIVAGIVVSAYDWALFNFDRVCFGEDETNFAAGDYTVTKYFGNSTVDSGETISVTNPNSFRVCKSNGDCCQQIKLKFPPVPRQAQSNPEFQWMTEEQETLSTIYGYTSMAALIAFLVIAFGGTIVNFLIRFFKGTYKPQGADQSIDFSSVPDIDGYVPQVKVSSSFFPLLACDVDDIDTSLIGWNDPGTSYDEYNLIFDVPYENMRRSKKITGGTRRLTRISDHPEYKLNEGNKADATPIFSIMKHYRRSYAVKKRSRH